METALKAGKSCKASNTAGETGTCYTELKVERERVEREGTLEDVIPRKTFTVNAIAVKAANTSQFRRKWNPGAYINQTTPENYGNAGALCC